MKAQKIKVVFSIILTSCIILSCSCSCNQKIDDEIKYTTASPAVKEAEDSFKQQFAECKDKGDVAGACKLLIKYASVERTFYVSTPIENDDVDWISKEINAKPNDGRTGYYDTHQNDLSESYSIDIYDIAHANLVTYDGDFAIEEIYEYDVTDKKYIGSICFNLYFYGHLIESKSDDKIRLYWALFENYLYKSDIGQINNYIILIAPVENDSNIIELIVIDNNTNEYVSVFTS